jgi:putative ATPase
VADLRREVDAARKLKEFSGQRTILFIDEIHRFNKAQQDAILPHVENATITLIGATTENPGFEVNSALRSRCRIFRLEKLSHDNVVMLLHRALLDQERGLAGESVVVEHATLETLARLADGDARIALSALEAGAAAVEPDAEGRRHVTLEVIEDVLQHPSLLYDKAGDMHYDLISAFIKSLRGSDPDAAVYWLARMLEAGEDPLFVARRMIILAAEDVGLADPLALVIGNACFQAVHAIGMPEAYLPLSECVLYLALAPKSNSALNTYRRVLHDVMGTLNEPVPLHLRNAVTSLDRAMEYGRGYRYAHDFDGHYVEQQYLPDALKGRRYYESSDQGHEKLMADRLGKWRDASS